MKSLAGIVVFGLALALTGCASEDAKEGVIDVKARDHSFVPDELEAEVGKVTFSISNIGSAVHEFEIFDDGKLVDEVEDIAPGLTRELMVSLKAGTYEYACKLDDHYERGMKGTLTVG